MNSPSVTAAPASRGGHQMMARLRQVGVNFPAIRSCVIGLQRLFTAKPTRYINHLLYNCRCIFRARGWHGGKLSPSCARLGLDLLSTGGSYKRKAQYQ